MDQILHPKVQKFQRVAKLQIREISEIPNHQPKPLTKLPSLQLTASLHLIIDG